MRKVKSRKKILYRFSLLLIILIVAILLFNINTIKVIFSSYITGYQEETIEMFFEDQVYDDVIKNNYSKTLEEIVKTEFYQKEFIAEYVNINYNETEDFLKEISMFLNKGYNSENINTIYDKLEIDGIKTLLEAEYFENIDDIITISFFEEKYLKRYLTYAKKEKEKDIETIVIYVNIGLDNSYYTNIQPIVNPDDLLVLVNKYNQLNKNYVPEKLQNVTYGFGQLKKEAAIAFDKMCEDAKKDNIRIYGGSGYRSYNYQLGLYNNYVTRDGEKLADTYAARAGHSEHQTGLAMDILNGNWEYVDEYNKEYDWLINNSYKYGFILRYLKDKEEITGYMYEPWHYRYVGVAVAIELTKIGITYEEYIAKK